MSNSDAYDSTTAIGPWDNLDQCGDSRSTLILPNQLERIEAIS